MSYRLVILERPVHVKRAVVHGSPFYVNRSFQDDKVVGIFCMNKSFWTLDTHPYTGEQYKVLIDLAQLSESLKLSESWAKSIITNQSSLVTG